MDSFARFTAILWTDLLDRMRSARFWVVLAIVAGAIWRCFPPANAQYMLLAFGGHYRGVYSSAWIGMVLAMISIWLALVGFYLVRGSLARDIDTKVWELLMATTMRRSTYLFAKWCSNMLVLALIVTVGLAVGVAAQIVRAEDTNIDLLEMVKPIFWLGVPSLALTAMFAIWFDMLPQLRRTAGNVLYFVVWLAMLAASAQTIRTDHDALSGGHGIGDPRGMAIFVRDTHRSLATQFGDTVEPGFCLACGAVKKQPTLFQWPSWQIDSAEIPGRIFWLFMAVLGVSLAAPFLDRTASRTTATGVDTTPGGVGGLKLGWLGTLLKPLQRSAGGNMLAAELQLSLRQKKVWWWIAMAIVWAVQFFSSLEVAAMAIMGAWILLLDNYSRSALRESEYRTAPIVFSAANAGHRVLLARWLTLLVLGGAFTLPALLRFCLSAPPIALAIMVVFASLATWGLALSALTRNSRTFEVLACVATYLGINGVPAINVVANPYLTITWHLALLPLAGFLLWLMWPRLRVA